MTASNIENIFNCIHRETMIALERSHPGERVTIFLSTDLYLRLEAVHWQKIQLSLDPSSKTPHIKLFGCNVEVYDDNRLSFYVTIANKFEF